MTNFFQFKNNLCDEFEDAYKKEDDAVLNLTNSRIQFTALSFKAWKISPVFFITGVYFETYSSPSRLSH
ncbi:MAG: hypothetical protein EBQ58_07835 [Betaproteobacteria bacterium]|nr:hypothetical protein [Betaproteobacteria bacterium]